MLWEHDESGDDGEANGTGEASPAEGVHTVEAEKDSGEDDLRKHTQSFRETR